MVPARNAGYTLVEIAIVLVIISLILGGIYTGGSAIVERSKVASLLSRLKDLGAAGREFKTRYGYFPGDLPNAGTLITANGGISAACRLTDSAVGNGLVQSTNGEQGCSIEQVAKAGLISKVDIDSGGAYFVSSGFGTGLIAYSYIPATNEPALSVSMLPCSIALEIDAKLDTASPGTEFSTGAVRALDSSGSELATCTLDTTVATLLVRY